MDIKNKSKGIIFKERRRKKTRLLMKKGNSIKTSVK